MTIENKLQVSQIDIIPIKRTINNPQRKFLYILILNAFLINHSFAGGNIAPEYGTIVVTGATADFVVVAADSRVTDADKQYNTCKITKLGDHAFFAAAGVAMERDQTGNILLDSVGSAKGLFQDALTLDDLSEKWANVMEASYYRIATVDRRAIPVASGENILHGVFGGIGNDGMSHIVYTRIIFEETGITRSFRHITQRVDPSADRPERWLIFGSEAKKYAIEYMLNQTPRSQAKKLELEKFFQTFHLSAKDRIALKMKVTAECAIEWGSNEDPLVGGAVAVLVETKTGAEWQTNTAECQR